MIDSVRHVLTIQKQDIFGAILWEMVGGGSGKKKAVLVKLITHCPSLTPTGQQAVDVYVVEL